MIGITLDAISPCTRTNDIRRKLLIILSSLGREAHSVVVVSDVHPKMLSIIVAIARNDFVTVVGQEKSEVGWWVRNRR